MATKVLPAFDISLLVVVAVSTRVFAADTERPESWLRSGELGPAPQRATNILPLSDQSNKGNWTKYEPLSDEFEAVELDLNKWWPKNPKWLGRQPAYFHPGNVRLSGGELHLTMRKQEVPEMPKDRGYHTYTSAAVQSKTKVKYGYFEIKARPMKSHGSSSFWFYDSAAEWWTEIDVFEIGGGAGGFERKYNMNVHVFKTPTEKRHWSVHGAWVAPSNLADDYHVYGLEWDNKKIKWYFDGVLVRWVQNTHWHQPLTLNFDSETMPEWFGLPRDADLPSTYSIEYVRAWKRIETTTGAEQTALTAVPLFSDMTFRQGFLLSYPNVSQGRRAEAVLDFGKEGSTPAWRLCQWGTSHSLAGAPCVQFDSGLVGYENKAKRVAVAEATSDSSDLLLEVKGAAEYRPDARKYGQSWPHLLIEQDAVNLCPLDELEELRFRVGMRLLHVYNHMKKDEYDPRLHAAQFQMFFIVKNTNSKSKDYGDYFWFGVPFFDSRHDIPPAYMAKDAGKDDATGKFIYTIAGSEINNTPLKDRDWVTLGKDLLPYIKGGLKEATQRRFLISSDPKDYAVVNMNLGWEIPGTFDAAIQIKGLSVTAVVEDKSNVLVE
ncbi:MAG: family 16 glycosylhydrolase [Phycisphaerales bacterium]|nr:MAG: family 16 glycosylhydrolase [Phycisphaerales bacterium]